MVEKGVWRAKLIYGKLSLLERVAHRTPPVSTGVCLPNKSAQPISRSDQPALAGLSCGEPPASAGGGKQRESLNLLHMGFGTAKPCIDETTA
jgi:hypothetical protein